MTGAVAGEFRRRKLTIFDGLDDDVEEGSRRSSTAWMMVVRLEKETRQLS